MPELHCRDERRRQQVRVHPRLNGLDYVEVSENHRRLVVFFLDKAPAKLTRENIRVKGLHGRPDLLVSRIEICRAASDYTDDCLKVWLDAPGELTCYSLCIVVTDEDGKEHRHPDFDPRYACVEFSFGANCPSDLDCTPVPCAPEVTNDPDINYLAKDYGSFRQLIFDRLALLVPEWRERHVPDLGVALVEVLAYVGDHLSYYQDAVATEAYLDTSRRRTSVRRHARLVDYEVHEGCSARAWVHVALRDSEALELDPERVAFVALAYARPGSGGAVVHVDDFKPPSSDAFVWFEPVTREPIHVRQAHNQIHFYTWGNAECCLPRGTTHATVADDYVDDPKQAGAAGDRPRRLSLRSGEVLIIEEILGPRTGSPSDANPLARHAIRLTGMDPDVDPLNDQPIVHIRWDQADALPFPVCLSAIGTPPACELIEPISVLRGNVILVDHGRRVNEPLGEIPAGDVEPCCEPCAELAAPAARRFRPVLNERPLTYRERVNWSAPASQQCVQDVRRARPDISVYTLPPDAAPATELEWTPRADLVSSSGDDRHFVVEVESDRRGTLRFGDGLLGRGLTAGDRMRASYRAGCGGVGNVGAEAIAYLVSRDKISGAALDVRNPLAACGGTEPETLDEIKARAPFAFRRELQRAVTADDYARLVEREFASEVQRAAAELRWTGSWYEAVVSIDPREASAADPTLISRIHHRLRRYRRIGHELRVGRGVHVPLDVALTVCVAPPFVSGQVKRALLERFGSSVQADSRPGLFHADRLTFGGSIFVSQLVAEARAVPGVENVTVTRLQRLGAPDEGALTTGALNLGPFEIAVLDNDPTAPERGTLSLLMRGDR